MRNKLLEALRTRELSLGTWLQLRDPACAELCARAGFDWACVDLEHAAIDVETMVDLFRALDAHGCVPVVRVPGNDPVWLHRALDAGAGGIVVPMVNSAEQARAAVREAKYPPRGTRSFGYSRANLHGVDFEPYVAAANDEIALIVQIEHKDAIDRIDAILEVDGIDAAFIGPYDLSGSMGLVGRFDHPDVQSALDTFRRACAAHGVAAGLHVVHPNAENVRRAVDDGYTLIALGVDAVFLAEAAAAARAAVPAPQGKDPHDRIR